MAYGRLNTPRFYMDANLLAYTTGMVDTGNSSDGNPMTIDENESLFTLNPWRAKNMQVKTVENGGLPRYISYGGSTKMESSKIIPSLDWFGILGIKKDSPARPIGFTFGGFYENTNGILTGGGDITSTNIIESYGATDFSGRFGIQNGYFLARFTNPYVNNVQNNEFYTTASWYLTVGSSAGETPDVAANLEVAIGIGAYCCGWSYTPSANPDLQLTESFSQDGVQSVRTIGGKDLTRINHTGCPQWLGDGLMPFQRSTTRNSVTDGERATYLSTRKRWSMQFSYIADTKLKPNFIHDNVNQTLNAPFTSSEITTSIDGVSATNLTYTGISDDFISKVWYGTMSGTLPFIFQPNKDVEEFHIVKFVDRNLELQQVAANTFNVSFELEEVW